MGDGVLYMVFGSAAAREAARSLATLRTFCPDLPAAVLGDKPVDGMQHIPWTGRIPFDPTKKHNFQFRAGLVKPHFYTQSPFDRTLYLDADTEILADIRFLFNVLDSWDLAIAKHPGQDLAELYNVPRAEDDVHAEGGAEDCPAQPVNTHLLSYRQVDDCRRDGAEQVHLGRLDEQSGVTRGQAEEDLKVVGGEEQGDDRQRAQNGGCRQDPLAVRKAGLQ